MKRACGAAALKAVVVAALAAVSARAQGVTATTRKKQTRSTKRKRKNPNPRKISTGEICAINSNPYPSPGPEIRIAAESMGGAQ